MKEDANPESRPYWRTLDELADDPAFQARLANEFPSEVEAITDPVERRTFLKLMAASLGLAGVTACTRQPPEKIIPYVRQPEEVVLGRPLFFATSMPLGGVATGLLVESHEGRPTKIEGNPLHPGSLGAADIHAQAAILSLYDPDRSQTLTHAGDIRPWSAFLGAMRAAMTAQAPLSGAGLRILTESISSPTLAAQIRDVLARYPSARWHQWDPASRENARAGAKLAFGEYVDAHYRTLADRRSRGLVGHSMGGYGAARIGMKHADVFGSLYVMSPCCLAARGGRPANPGTDSVLESVRTPADEAKLSFFQRATLASAAAWSPDPKNPPLYLDLPTRNGVAQPDVLARWAANAPLAFVDQYVGSLRTLDGIAMDVGDQDGLRTDAAKLHEAMDRYGIANAFEVYPGTHTSAVADRFQNHVLPFFGRHLCPTVRCQ